MSKKGKDLTAVLKRTGLLASMLLLANSLYAQEKDTTLSQGKQTMLSQDKEATLQEVVVTGTGTKHLLKNAPVQTEVITKQMLSQYGGKSLEDILAGLEDAYHSMYPEE